MWKNGPRMRGEPERCWESFKALKQWHSRHCTGCHHQSVPIESENCSQHSSLITRRRHILWRKCSLSIMTKSSKCHPTILIIQCMLLHWSSLTYFSIQFSRFTQTSLPNSWHDWECEAVPSQWSKGLVWLTLWAGNWLKMFCYIQNVAWRFWGKLPLNSASKPLKDRNVVLWKSFTGWYLALGNST